MTKSIARAILGFAVLASAVAAVIGFLYVIGHITALIFGPSILRDSIFGPTGIGLSVSLIAASVGVLSAGALCFIWVVCSKVGNKVVASLQDLAIKRKNTTPHV
jgi:hypothetical protein